MPELNKFHEIIFTMWHEAYPAKDIKALKGFVPRIKEDMEKINKAQLPGILREKEDDWKKQLVEFNAAADNYYKAAAGNDDQAMLDAAEKLHHDFEMTNRVIRPVLKEVDQYHKTLYVIYHKLYPDKKYSEIAKLSDSFVQQAEAITKCNAETLKKRLGGKVPVFHEAAKNLYEATVQLKEILKGNDDSKKEEAVLNVHASYKKLEALFQ
ncbi:MAG: hypothetical protein V2A54_09520 [Bacteroidota bacterium]